MTAVAARNVIVGCRVSAYIPLPLRLRLPARARAAGGRAAGRSTSRLSGRQVFPATNWWNSDISAAPVDSRSAALIDFISGRTADEHDAVRRLHPGLRSSALRLSVRRRRRRSAARAGRRSSPTADESDTGCAGAARLSDSRRGARPRRITSRGACAGGGTSGDRHMLVIDRDRWLLYETFATLWNGGAARWEAGSGAVFDLIAQRSPAGGLDVRRCRGPGDLSGTHPLRRGVRHRRDHARVSRDDARAATDTCGRRRTPPARTRARRRWARACG